MSLPMSSDWLQFYQPNNLSDQSPPPPTAASGWTVDIATDPTSNITPSTNSSRVNRTNTRRRTRASRRTPTTLVNTDTTNFRAMVQQFTGGSLADDHIAPTQYFAGYNNNNNNNNSASLSFGLGPTGSVMAAEAPGVGYNLQFRQSIDGSGGGGQQYYQGEHHHQAFLQSLQNYITSGATGEDVGHTDQSRGSSFLH